MWYYHWMSASSSWVVAFQNVGLVEAYHQVRALGSPTWASLQGLKDIHTSLVAYMDLKTPSDREDVVLMLDLVAGQPGDIT